MSECTLKWYPLSDAAIIPTKEDGNAGFDIYTTERNVYMPPHSQHLFKTDLACIIDDNYWLMGFDRGSTGSKGMHLHCGVVDPNYLGEIFVCLKNDNDYPIIVGAEGINTEDVDDKVKLIYPATKAIVQLIPVEKPKVNSTIASKEEYAAAMARSTRKDGKLGSSGK